MIDRIQIIQHFIDKYHYTEYLELGIFFGVTFQLIKCENKDSVDTEQWKECPFKVKYKMSIDKFFEKECKKQYDIIFIDACHEEEQVDKDLNNSLKWLKENGTIILHDCNAPAPEGSGERTVWRSISKFNCTENGYTCHVVDVDHGVGIIRKGIQEKHKLSIEQSRMWENRVLNLISPEKFLELY